MMANDFIHTGSFIVESSLGYYCVCCIVIVVVCGLEADYTILFQILKRLSNIWRYWHGSGDGGVLGIRYTIDWMKKN